MTTLLESTVSMDFKPTPRKTGEKRLAPAIRAARALRFGEEPRPLRVLVVDDEADTADSTRALLELLGYETGVAYCGATAVAAARVLRPDVVLLDLALPGMDGFAVAEALRELPGLAGVRLIAISGYAPHAMPGPQLPMFERHLIKPVALEELQTVLQSCRAFGRD